MFDLVFIFKDMDKRRVKISAYIQIERSDIFVTGHTRVSLGNTVSQQQGLFVLGRIVAQIPNPGSGVAGSGCQQVLHGILRTYEHLGVVTAEHSDPVGRNFHVGPLDCCCCNCYFSCGSMSMGSSLTSSSLTGSAGYTLARSWVGAGSPPAAFGYAPFVLSTNGLVVTLTGGVRRCWLAERSRSFFGAVFNSGGFASAFRSAATATLGPLVSGFVASRSAPAGLSKASRLASITSGMTASMSESGSPSRSVPSSATLISASIDFKN
ncbi:hypothetical protein BpHYR1_050347 [Brachionus plicatilis]|uniref:Uncharacterized protein n=1 Tax=Brachionus plicatilis TaxID=10195 RepID=A0A3M7T2H3_BRAPC|nr:hypothetical protein BpHYR1_050347 [Brachionus plicatilis]